MKIIKFNKSAFCSLILLCSLIGCSSEESVENNSGFDHGHGTGVGDLQKHKFAHAFAEQCMDRELRTSGYSDRERFEKPCMCIATKMMENLTVKEAQKFLEEKKSTRSLEMRFNNAAYHCVDEQIQSPPAGPVIFNTR